jgi:hypothetical protein
MTFMQKLNALIKLGLALALFAGIAHAQSANNGYPYSSLSVPAITQYTFVAEKNSTSIASITSPSLTLPSGAFVGVFCRGPAALTSIVVTSSPSTTWTAEALQSFSGQQAAQLSIGSPAAGATTFTCTPNTSAGYQSMIVFVVTGTLGTVNTTVGSAVTSATSVTSPAFTTTGRTLTIMCAGTVSLSSTYTPGLIGGIVGSIGAASLGSIGGTGADGVCASSLIPYAVPGATAIMAASPASYWAETVVAVNY